jgi:hypothetical protein
MNMSMYLYMSINTKTDLDMVMSIHSFIHFICRLTEPTDMDMGMKINRFSASKLDFDQVTRNRFITSELMI